jgi:hypothetical protein
LIAYRSSSQTAQIGESLTRHFGSVFFLRTISCLLFVARQSVDLIAALNATVLTIPIADLIVPNRATIKFNFKKGSFFVKITRFEWQTHDLHAN